MKPRTTPDKILARYAREFDTLKADLMQLDFFCKGTVLHRTLKRGRPPAPAPTTRHSVTDCTSSGHIRWPAKP